MKLILTSAIDKLGIPGDIVEVRDGYGRNYLLPQGKAIAYNRGTAKQIEGIKRARAAKQVRDNVHAAELREQIEALRVSVVARADATGKLYGAITPNTIAQAIKKAGGPAVDKRSVSVAKPIKATGSHQASVRLTDAVTARVTIEVAAA